MANGKETAFLCKRMKELRERNNCTMDELIAKLNQEFNGKFSAYNKSSISRLESGKTSEKTAKEFAEYYCKVFHLTDNQRKRFLAGERIVVPDTSALLKNSNLIPMLEREYNKVMIPVPIVDELVNIKNNFDNKYSLFLSKRAREVERSIENSNKTQTIGAEYHDSEESTDYLVILIAQDLSDQYHCNVDIITEDVDYQAYLQGNDAISAIQLREYIATHQEIFVNMTRLIKINEYYADSYDDIEDIPPKDEINAYLSDGTTLITSCVRMRDPSVPMNQRKEKIKWLISNGADVNARESDNRFLPAISCAIQTNQYEMFEFLLDECNANPNAGSRNPHGAGKVRQRNEGNTPLMVAAWSGRDNYIRKLLDNSQISINQQDANGFTALIKAATNGHSRCMKLLIDAGADTRIVDIDGKDYQQHYNEALENGPLKDRYLKGKKQGPKKRNWK